MLIFKIWEHGLFYILLLKMRFHLIELKKSRANMAAKDIAERRGNHEVVKLITAYETTVIKKAQY